MAKLTKREYEQKFNVLEARIDFLKDELLRIEAEDVTAENADLWNETYDTMRDLEKELMFLEDEWSRRNWTHQDHAQWDLITSNID